MNAASPAAVGSYQNTSEQWQWPCPNPHCAHRGKPPVCTVTIAPSKSHRHNQRYKSFPQVVINHALYEMEKKSQFRAPAGTMENSSPEDSRIMKNIYIYIYTYLHALPPCNDPIEACAQEAAHLLSSISRRTGETEQKSFALTLLLLSRCYLCTTLQSHLIDEPRTWNLVSCISNSLKAHDLTTTFCSNRAAQQLCLLNY